MDMSAPASLGRCRTLGSATARGDRLETIQHRARERKEMLALGLDSDVRPTHKICVAGARGARLAATTARKFKEMTVECFAGLAAARPRR